VDLVEHYNQLLRTTEDDTLLLLNKALDASFQRLVRRTRIQIDAPYTDPAQRNLALLEEFRQLVPIYNPERVDTYDRLFRGLITRAQANGIDVASALTGQMSPGRPRLDVSLPLDAAVSAASQARGYLTKHGERFAETSAQVVTQGILEGRPTDAMIRDLRMRLSVVKSRAENIIRTESLRAYNDAADQYYNAQGISLVVYYATSDDRTCPWCTPRAGKVYRRSEIRVPLHPRCRCYIAPWDEDLASIDQDYANSRLRHQRQVEAAFKRTNQEPVDLNRAAVFEQYAPAPVV
jgi:SPP1 gp7 family putative phage head morphogenesis protein